MNKVLNKIKEKNIIVGVVGMGYVGLPLALEYAIQGVKTIGFELDSNKVDLLNKGINYNQDIDNKLIEKSTKNKLLSATTDFSRLQECDVLFICVPTPFTVNKDPDISYIIKAAEDIQTYLKKGQIIILKSTTFPGTTQKYVLPILEKSGLQAGKDFYLAFSPERIDPGNKFWNTRNTPIVVGGINEESTKLAVEVTKIAIEKVVPVSSPSIAEMEKLLENIFRSVNIALVNELAQLCDRIGVNIWEVVEAASTKPFGFMPFWPGPGIGGHCILIDPYYLSWMAREYDFETKFITLAAEINEDMPFYVRSMIVKEIAKQPVTLENARVLLLGMAFKKDVDDLRHSPALKVMELLLLEGIKNVSYHDPYIPQIKVNGQKFDSVKNLTSKLIKNYDIVVVTTDHSVFDYEMIAKNAKSIIDTRNAFKNVKNKKNVVLLGDGK
ncbi:nucleotide sugar dehydrogenase [Bacteroidetes/Chlorobi group bacterium ChocPot_Mid]|jgi:UDP-N-acetyl-D-glucosamine dehydrogenase|nr:MAG: nucleotide sugar dehydrogenase [Bacteroidetes/Chlorobi group bacterium ChocPot_Mid]